MNKIHDKEKRNLIATTVDALSSAVPRFNSQLRSTALFLKQQVNKSRPSYPAIAFNTSQSVKICHSHEDISKIRLSDFQYQTDNQIIYDSSGNIWSFQYSTPPFAINFWNELRNPEYVSTPKWKFFGSYNLDDLKYVFKMLLEKNDDVLTEYETEQHLNQVLHSCSSFNEIIAILKKYVFEVNEAELWQEQENRSST